MDHVVRHLVSRGMDAHASFRASSDAGRQPSYEMPTWGVAILCSTAIAFLLLLSTIEYTYGGVIATLAMIESPTTAVFEAVTNEDPDAPLDDKKDGLAKPVEPELFLVKQAPITSKLHKAVRHLRERAGFLSQFRGFSIFIVHQIVLARLTSFLSHIGFIWGVDAVLAAVVLARLRMGWTHIVISEPSPKYWFQRLANWRLWKKVALPTAVLAICERVTLALPAGLWVAFGMSRFNDPQKIADLDESARKLLLLKALAVLLLGLFSPVAIVVPASVSLTRVHASLLSEEEETIVPFDRSFGGRVVPAIVGGSGVIGMLDAWKTFDWNSRVRLLKIYLKVIAMEVAALALFVVVIFAQLQYIMGDEFRKYVQWARGSFHH